MALCSHQTKDDIALRHTASTVAAVAAAAGATCYLRARLR